MGKLGVFGIARCTRALLEVLLERRILCIEVGEVLDPRAVLVNALGESVEHGVGGVVHLAAELVAVLAEVLGMLVGRPENAAGRKWAVAVSQGKFALLQQHAFRALALEGYGCGRCHAR